MIWYDNLQKIKEFIEFIAKNEFKKTRDPVDSALWFFLLGKITIVAQLCKKDQRYKKVADFLTSDFTLEKSKSIASKNAFALLSKKNYLASAAFFILAG